MLNFETTTKYPMEKAAAKVKSFFGEGGLGLDLVDDSSNCLSFEGGGGYVAVNFCTEAKKTLIKFETREWERQVRKFAMNL